MSEQETARENSDTGAEDDAQQQNKPPPEVGGPRGKEPTRYGDWERNGRCIDF